MINEKLKDIHRRENMLARYEKEYRQKKRASEIEQYRKMTRRVYGKGSSFQNMDRTAESNTKI